MQTQGRVRAGLLSKLLGVSVLFFALNATAEIKSSKVNEAKLKPGAVIYGVVPPLFGKQPFKDVSAKLSEIRELGADVLWLSPINKTDDPSQISYAVTDYYKVREDFGSADDLRALVSEAKSHGLKVIMDFVPNHTSNQHPYFLEAEKLGAKSRYFAYYDRDAKGEPTYYFDWAHLPNLNYAHPPVAKEMISTFRYWIRSFGLDGFRVDAAWGVKKRAPEFWKKLSEELAKDQPTTLLLAEASARDSYYYSNGFDLAYDWTNKLGVWAWKEAFENPSRIADLLDQAIRANPEPQRVARFLNNNDTGERFISRHGLKFTKVAAVFQHTVPGIPIVYTGDEIGAEYDPYQDPPPLVWKDPHSLRTLYRKLASLREEYPALHSGTYERVPLGKKPKTLAYLRLTTKGEWALVFVNFGPKTRLEFDIPEKIRTASHAKDLLTSETKIDLNGKRASLELSAKSAFIFVPQPGSRAKN
jgi:glycosidase